ncbi:MAG: ribosome silencing factor [Treponema sp.]|nr:ribosome silencing factor [Treponema sp.]
MEDTLPVIDKESKTEIDQTAAVNGIAELIQDHKGQNVSVLDLRGINGWTDFFIIATVTSNTHMEGLVKHIKEFCNENELMIFGSSRKNQDDQWRLIDLGSIVIHLMTSAARDFYELERLWAHNKKT